MRRALEGVGYGRALWLRPTGQALGVAGKAGGGAFGADGGTAFCVAGARAYSIAVAVRRVLLVLAFTLVFIVVFRSCRLSVEHLANGVEEQGLDLSLRGAIARQQILSRLLLALRP